MIGFLAAPEWVNYVNAAQVLNAIAMSVAAMIGAGSLLAIVVQTRTSANVAHEAMAMEVHKELMRLSIEYPHLSSAAMSLRYIGRRTFKNVLENESDPKIEEVLWFLSYALFAMEQVLSVTRRRGRVDRAWFETARDVLGYHQAILREVWPSWRTHYSDGLVKVVDQILTMKVGADGLVEPAPSRGRVATA